MNYTKEIKGIPVVFNFKYDVDTDEGIYKYTCKVNGSLYGNSITVLKRNEPFKEIFDVLEMNAEEAIDKLLK
jgi:hypothetical protein